MNKVTKESIEAKIKDVQYRKLTHKLTHCLIIMENGFQVTGESACVDPKNYDQAIGEKCAYENAFEKIWMIEGYLLQEKLNCKKSAYELFADAFAEELNKVESNQFLNGSKTVEKYRKEYPLTEDQAFKYDPNEKRHMDQFTKKKDAEMGLGAAATKGADLNTLIQVGSFPSGFRSFVRKDEVIEAFLKMDQNTKFNLFCQMFPDCHNHSAAFDIAEGKVVSEEKPMLRIENFFPEDPSLDKDFQIFPVTNKSEIMNKLPMGFVSKKQLFEFMFPEAKESDFKSLLKREQITDELSFMEKFGELMIEKSKNIERSITKEQEYDFQVKFNKLCRKEMDIILQAIKGSERTSRARSISMTKLEEAIMWLGMDLKELGEANPYPDSKNPSNTKIETTADGLKL